MTTLRRQYLAGARVGLGLGVATFVLGVTFGAYSQTLAWGIVAPIVASIVVFSGSAQFAMATALAGGGNLAVAVGAAALINARFLPMGVSVAGDLRGGRLRRAWEGQAVVDGSWVASHLGGGRYDREKMIGCTLVQLPAWVLGTVLGVVAAPSPDIVARFGLDVVFPGFFLVLLIDELRRSREAVWTAALAACLAGILVLFVPVGLALIGASAAAVLGLAVRR
ncbi:AzlC family ABC transporter permease [Amycolatopsis sp. NPDC051071]|uniref:AzlC family ABC transporter permease n=1 Tax=Amycolatopsis sp. NPDC051071 TaxID=3154637 RepID=UPI00343751FF